MMPVATQGDRHVAEPPGGIHRWCADARATRNHVEKTVRVLLSPAMAGDGQPEQVADRTSDSDKPSALPDLDAPPATEEAVMLRHRSGPAARVPAPHMRLDLVTGARGNGRHQDCRPREMPWMMKTPCGASIAAAACRHHRAVVLTNPDVRGPRPPLAEPIRRRHVEHPGVRELVVRDVAELTHDGHRSDALKPAGSTVDHAGAMWRRRSRGGRCDHDIAMASRELRAALTRLCVTGETARCKAVRDTPTGEYAALPRSDAATAQRLPGRTT